MKTDKLAYLVVAMGIVAVMTSIIWVFAIARDWKEVLLAWACVLVAGAITVKNALDIARRAGR